MNTEDGRVMTMEEAARLNARMSRQVAVPMDIPPTPKQLRVMKVGRNDPCPCGSGKKFKKCHLDTMALKR